MDPGTPRHAPTGRGVERMGTLHVPSSPPYLFFLVSAWCVLLLYFFCGFWVERGACEMVVATWPRGGVCDSAVRCCAGRRC
jgi:hypothetical protein